MWGFGRQMASFFSESMGDDPSGSSTGGGRFRKHYACYPVSFAGKDVMEKGNKILLPQSALHQLARMNITWPMLFEMTEPNTVRESKLPLTCVVLTLCCFGKARPIHHIRLVVLVSSVTSAVFMYIYIYILSLWG
eukprot:GHVS01077176.1.p1 GENE.GHVS01077176.1~~GHVS01077176.1.p1  ORF type:complete len:135 (+),score=5.63 GHVS01077176.1:383-787(+)